MERSYSKEYIEISNDFRKTNGSKESIEKLYDLLYALESSSRTADDDITLSNVYAILGYHQCAYDVFKSVANLNDKKTTSKLYVMEAKAKSHKNNFVIKDLRKFRQKNERSKLLITDFLESETEENQFSIIDKDIVIFNKLVKNEKLAIFIYGNHKIEDYAGKIADYIFWLGNCKNELIEFYNRKISEDIQEEADDDWYDSFEIFGVRVIVGQNATLFAEISVGDDLVPDHILDIEIEEHNVTGMNYDG